MTKSYKNRKATRVKKQNKNKKTMKSQKQRMKNVIGFSFFLILVSRNNNSVFNRGFYLMQAVNCSLRLSGDSYDQKYIFAKYFQRQFNVRQGKFSVNNLVAFQTK